MNSVRVFSEVLIAVGVYALTQNVHASQPGGVPGGMLGGAFPEFVSRADAVAVILIDAGQTTPSIVHGTVRESVKGMGKGTDLCILLHQYSPPPIGGEVLVFLSRTSDPPVGSRISSYSGIGSSLMALQGRPFPIVETFPVSPCITSPCARTTFCAAVPCSKTRTVLRPGRVVPGLSSPAPNACPTANNDVWVKADELLEALRRQAEVP
jgi:hypothetical protein